MAMLAMRAEPLAVCLGVQLLQRAEAPMSPSYPLSRLASQHQLLPSRDDDPARRRIDPAFLALEHPAPEVTEDAMRDWIIRDEVAVSDHPLPSADRLSPLALLLGVAWLLAPDTASAQQCKDRGGLAYLGVTANEGRSVWLSATGAGSFQLESTQGSQVVDQWDRSRRGLRVTLSPVVSSGNGGVHQLLVVEGNRPCMIDSQNQKGGITFPSFIHLPELRP